MASNLCKVKRVMTTLPKTLTGQKVIPQGLMMWGCQRSVRCVAAPRPLAPSRNYIIAARAIPESQPALPPPPPLHQSHHRTHTAERLLHPNSDPPHQRPSGAVEEERKGSPDSAATTTAEQEKKRGKRVSPSRSDSPPQRPSGEAEEERKGSPATEQETRRGKRVSPPSSGSPLPSPAYSDHPIVRSRRLKERAAEKRKFVVFSPRLTDEESERTS